MEIVQRVEIFDVRRPDLTARPQRSHDRLHVSTLIAHVARRLGVLTAQDEADTIEGHIAALEEYESHGHSALLTKIALGLSWEDWLLPQLPGVDYHSGEIELDGIVGSPDGLEALVLDPYGDDLCIHEAKLTWDYAGSGVTAKWLYLAQCKAYCKILGTLRACLHICYVNGFMSAGTARAKAGMPYAVAYDIRFTQEEIEQNWRSLLTARRDILTEGQNPSFKKVE